MAMDCLFPGASPPTQPHKLPEDAALSVRRFIHPPFLLRPVILLHPTQFISLKTGLDAGHPLAYQTEGVQYF